MSVPATSLSGRTAFVTGGGSGIGRAICKLFAVHGAAVAVVDRAAERAEETAHGIVDAGGRALALTADVSHGDTVDAAATAATQLGTVDILVNNAAVAPGDDLLDIDEETWDLNLDVVLKGAYLCSKALLPPMLDAGRGSVLNIASVNGLTGICQDAYSAAKAGMINLTRNMALRYGPRGVRVNAICPGTVRTPIWEQFLEKDPQVFERLTPFYPLGRVGEPDDIANAALFLVSDAASWITGQVLAVDGGLTAGIHGLGRAVVGEGD